MSRTEVVIPPGSSVLAAPRHRAVTVVLAALVVLLVGFPSSVSWAQGYQAEVKAELIERFTRFVQWPAESSVSNPSLPFVVGIIGDASVAEALERVVARTPIKGKRTEVRRLADAAGIAGCQLVFLSQSKDGLLEEVLAAVKGKPVLTVSESTGHARRGVVFNFSQEGEFVRFEVNPKAAEAAGLKVSPQLVALGILVGS